MVRMSRANGDEELVGKTHTMTPIPELSYLANEHPLESEQEVLSPGQTGPIMSVRTATRRRCPYRKTTLLQ